MLIFEIPWSKLCDKNPNCTFLWIFSLLWRHVCVEPSLFTQTFQKPKKYFVKNLLSHFEKRPKRRDSYQVLSFSATFLKQTLTSYNCTVPQKWKNRAILLKVDCHQCTYHNLDLLPRGLKSFSVLRLGVGYFGEKVSNCYCLTSWYCTFFGILQPLWSVIKESYTCLGAQL